MSALTSTLVDICSAGAGRVWVEQCLAMPQWAQMAQYRTRYAALQITLDEVSRRLEQGQDCHLCVLTPDAIRSLQSRWPERIDWIGSLGQAETGWVSLAGDGQSYAGGAQAVAALSAHAGQRVMACAQSTEVQSASHALYLGPFPAPHGLFTEYALAAVRPHPDNHDPEAQAAWTLACDLARYLCSPSQQARRLALGFVGLS